LDAEDGRDDVGELGDATLALESSDERLESTTPVGEPLLDNALSSSAVAGTVSGNSANFWDLCGVASESVPLKMLVRCYGKLTLHRSLKLVVFIFLVLTHDGEMLYMWVLSIHTWM